MDVTLTENIAWFLMHLGTCQLISALTLILNKDPIQVKQEHQMLALNLAAQISSSCCSVSLHSKDKIWTYCSVAAQKTCISVGCPKRCWGKIEG